MNRLLSSLIAFIITGAIMLAAVAGHVQAQPERMPPDVALDVGEGAELPPIPDGFLRERRGGVEWVYPEAAADVATDLFEAYDESWPRIVDELGGDVGHDLVIRIGRNPEEMAELAPRGPGGGRPPEYATGVAYPRLGVVLLTLTAPETWERPAVEAVLAHELSHIALHRAVRGQPLPRWFVEGVAVHQAREHSFGRVQALWQGTVRGKLLPLRQLSRSFPARPHEVNLAYAQSADFVGFLRSGDDGPARFERAIERLRNGESFEQALRRSYGVGIGTLEGRWRDGLAERYQTLPLVLTGGGLWVLITMLLVVAWLRRRRDKKKKLAQWADEDAAFVRMEQVLDTRVAPPPPPPPPPPRHDEERVVIVVPGDPPQGREPGVPTIEYEGRNHTVH